VKIHFFTDYFRPEPPPPAHHIAERARIWANDGHQVTVITNHPNYPEGKIYPGYRNRPREVVEQDGYRVVRVWTHVAHHQSKIGKLLDHASYFASATLQALRLDKPDVVAATTPHLFCGLAGSEYARLARRPLMLEVRDLWPDSVLPRGSASYRVFKSIERHLYRSAAAVSVLTPAFESHVLAEGARRAATIVGGTDLSRFTPGDPPPGRRHELGLEGMYIVGYPGTLGTAHDIDLLLDAARLLRDTRVRFLLIGGGPFIQDLESRAIAACPGMIRFVPTQPPEEMPGWWRSMDAGLVLLKKNEAMRTVIPSKMFESMATGKPVIFVGPRGAGSAVAEDGGGGIVVDGEGPEQLARELSDLAGNGARQRALEANALNASPRFSRERQASETLALLRSLVGGA
jgi:colanic acid biosynthesis glycosyl transferase WcaI